MFLKTCNVIVHSFRLAKIYWKCGLLVAQTQSSPAQALRTCYIVGPSETSSLLWSDGA